MEKTLLAVLKLGKYKMKICKVCLKKISGQQRYSDYHNTCLTKLLGSLTVSPTLSFNRDLFKTEIHKYTKGMSISGVQKKLSLKISDQALCLTNTGGTYILKPTVEDFSELSQNEHLSMLIGKTLGIDTPPLGLIKFSDGELVYLIKRFDWLKDKKIHKEDMTQIFELNRNENETYKYSQSYEEVGQKLIEITNGKMIVALDFFNRLVYNYIIQNGDYHLKNISVVAEQISKQGFYEKLAPNYDSVMTRLYFSSESELALDLLKDDKIPESYKTIGWFTRSDFEELGLKIGLSGPATGVIFDRIKKNKIEIHDLISMSFLSNEKKIQYTANITERLIKLDC